MATEAQQQHDKLYGGQNDGQPASAQDMGAAAAMKVFKSFGGAGQGQAQDQSSQSKVIGMVMSEASNVSHSHLAHAFAVTEILAHVSTRQAQKLTIATSFGVTALRQPKAAW
jgi:hypothetical protein